MTLSARVDSPRVIDRVRELAGDGEVSRSESVTYSWNEGYETYTRERDGQITFQYRGVYHPAGSCEGDGVCRWCGRTLRFG